MWETCPRSGVRTAGFGLVLLCGVWRELGRLDAIGSVGRDGGGRRWRHSAAGAAHLGFARRAARSRWRRAARRGRCLWGAVAQIFAAAPAARPPARAGSSITTSRWPASSGRVGLAGCPTPGGWRLRRAGRPARSLHARRDRGVFLPAPVARPPARAGSFITTGRSPASSGRVILAGGSAPVGSRFRRAGGPARSLRARRDRDVFLPAPVARTPAPAGSLITTGRSPASSGRLLLAGSSAPVGSRFRRAGRPARSLHAWRDRGVFPSAPVARPPAPAGSFITTGCWPASSGRVLLAGSSAPVGSRFRRAGRPARSLRARRDCGVFPPAPVARPPAPAGSFVTTGCWPASSGRVLLAGCSAPVGSRFRRAGRPARSLHARRDRGVFLPALVARPPAPAGSSITTGRSPASSGRVLLAGSSAPVGSRFRRAGRPARSLPARRDRGVFPPAPTVSGRRALAARVFAPARFSYTSRKGEGTTME